MESHSTHEPAAPSRPWLPFLLIAATLLASGLLCSDALARLAPAPGSADTEVQPRIALVPESVQPTADASRDALVVDAPDGSTSIAEPPEDAVVEVASLEHPPTIVDAGPASGGPSDRSNGNTNPNANPNGLVKGPGNGNGRP